MAKIVIVEVRMDVQEILAATLQPASSTQALSAIQATKDAATFNVNSLRPEPSAGHRLDSVIRKKPAPALLLPAHQTKHSQMVQVAEMDFSVQADSAHLETRNARQSWAATPRATIPTRAILSLAPSHALALVLV